MVPAACLLVIGGRGGAGHSVGHFPSYYPDEIRIDVVDPKAAGAGLADATLHAYVGAVPSFAEAVPEHVKSAKSLGSILLLSFNAGSTRFTSADDRCAAARGLLTAMKEERAAGFVFHPYPVTPYHADYLHHLDRVEAAKAAVGGSASVASVKVGARGQVAEAVALDERLHAGNDHKGLLPALGCFDFAAAEETVDSRPANGEQLRGLGHANDLGPERRP